MFTMIKVSSPTCHKLLKKLISRAWCCQTCPTCENPNTEKNAVSINVKMQRK